MQPDAHENSFSVLLGASGALIAALVLALPLAALGAWLYLTVSGSEVPLEWRRGTEIWELELAPVENETEVHAELTRDLSARFEDARFEITTAQGSHWLRVVAPNEAALRGAQDHLAAEGLGTDTLRIGGFLELAHPSSVRATKDWLVTHPGAMLSAASGQSVAFLLVGLVLIHRNRERGFHWSPPEASLSRALAEGGVGGVVLLLGAILLSQLAQLFGAPVEEQGWVRSALDSGGLPGLYFLACIAAPISEEVFFRRGLFQSLDVRLSRPLALVVSSFYFAAVHLNPSGMIVYLWLGAGLAALHARSRTLIAPVLAHSVVNAGVLLLS